MTPEEQETALRLAARASNLSEADLRAILIHDWRIIGRPKQQPPPGDDWTYWYILAGRGFGKTITGAQETKKVALAGRNLRIGLVAPTLGDVRDTMVEGETGLLSIIPERELRGGSRDTAWNRGPCELYLANGTKIKGFSSVEPDRLRGPQHHFVWGEEVSSWKDAHVGDKVDTTWSNVKIGCRLGDHPRVVLTSTPKPNKLTKELVALAEGGDLVLVKGSSYENRDNLAETYWRVVVEPYEGTRTGRQEIMAEVLEDVEGALWTSSQIDLLRVVEAPPLQRIVVGVDPNVSSSATADAAGIVVVGESLRDRQLYVLADRTITRGGPTAWAQASVDAYHDFEADRIIGEINNGGEMVELTIRTVDPNVSYKGIHATRGKRVRAEPVAALYEGAPDWTTDPQVRQPRAHHVGVHALLEEEMTTWTPEDESPNRMDALVWAMTELGLGVPPGYGRSSVPRGRIPGVGPRDVGFRI